MLFRSKGTKHALRVIRDVLFFQPEGRGTSVKAALDFLNRVQRRRAICFLLSDFLDRGFERAFRRTGRRHDLTAIHISDLREEELPPVGLVEVEDGETGRRLLLDTSSTSFRRAYAASGQQRHDEVRQLARSSRVDLIEVSTDGGHLDALVRFFQLREHRLRRT